MANETSRSIGFSDDQQLTIPVRVGWSVALTVFLNVLLLCFLYVMISGSMQANSLGVEWLGVGIIAIVLLVFDILSIPQIFRHYIRFEENYLKVVLGLHKAQLRYFDIQTVAEKFSGLAFQWNSTAPGGVRIHGRIFDEVVAVTDKELLYAELLKRNPNIKIERS